MLPSSPLHSPIGEPLSLALENVAILWWATPPENWRARQWLTSNRSPQSAGPWQFHEQTLRNCIVVEILWWVAPENATIRNYCRSIILLMWLLLKMSCNHSFSVRPINLSSWGGTLCLNKCFSSSVCSIQFSGVGSENWSGRLEKWPNQLKQLQI